MAELDKLYRSYSQETAITDPSASQSDLLANQPEEGPTELAEERGRRLLTEDKLAVEEEFERYTNDGLYRVEGNNRFVDIVAYWEVSFRFLINHLMLI